MFAGTLSQFVTRHAMLLCRALTPRKTLNVGLSLLEYLVGRARLRGRPFAFRVDPSTACNLRCDGCEAHTQTTTETRLMTLPVFERVLARIRRYGIRLSLYDTGEPMVNRHLFSMVAQADAAGLSTMTNTNFNLFRPQHLEPLFASGLKVLSLSIDGITQQSYQRYRRRGLLGRVLESLRWVVERKAQLGTGPLIEVQVIDLDHLRPHKQEIMAFFRARGADRVVWKRETWGFNAASERGNQRAGRCFWLYMGAMIRPDGQLYPCCGMGFDRFAYGNVLEQSIDEIWNNAYYRFSRALFQSGPDLPFDPTMRQVPCLSCELFTKKRGMQSAPVDRRALIPVVQHATGVPVPVTPQLIAHGGTECPTR